MPLSLSLHLSAIETCEQWLNRVNTFVRLWLDGMAVGVACALQEINSPKCEQWFEG